MLAWLLQCLMAMDRDWFTSTRQPAGPLTLIRWEFIRGEERLSCQIDRAAGNFAVVVMPYRRIQKTTTEIFQKAAAALCRHAALVSRLRATGWKLVSYTS